MRDLVGGEPGECLGPAVGPAGTGIFEIDGLAKYLRGAQRTRPLRGREGGKLQRKIAERARRPRPGSWPSVVRATPPRRRRAGTSTRGTPPPSRPHPRKGGAPGSDRARPPRRRPDARAPPGRSRWPAPPGSPRRRSLRGSARSAPSGRLPSTRSARRAPRASRRSSSARRVRPSRAGTRNKPLRRPGSPSVSSPVHSPTRSPTSSMLDVCVGSHDAGVRAVDTIRSVRSTGAPRSAIFLLVVSLALAGAAWASAQPGWRRFDVPATGAYALRYLPTTLPAGPAPVVVFLHGSGSSPEAWELSARSGRRGDRSRADPAQIGFQSRIRSRRR